MKNFGLWLKCAIASFIPWGAVVVLFSDNNILWAMGLAVQLIGLTVMIVKRKEIW